ncbi:MAG: VanW family protein [Clostridiales bacterium]|nr:VanW family protein [Clostridiales bacterium]
MRGYVEKPRYRSQLRLVLGKTYYTLKRYALWAFAGDKFAFKAENELKYEFISHQTPLLRNLKDVDMHMQFNKITNLTIAVEKINYATIAPGETFSFWKMIGKPSIRKGYLKGMVLQNGKITSRTGGGLCQLSNLIYWMTVHTPLTVLERHRHGYDVFPDSDRTQPFGSGATCFYNYGDLVIKNNTGSSFQLALNLSETHLLGSWKSDSPPECKYEVYEKDHIIRHETWGGYTRHNLIHRKKCGLDGCFIEDEYVVENHAIMMYAPLLVDAGLIKKGANAK